MNPNTPTVKSVEQVLSVRAIVSETSKHAEKPKPKPQKKKKGKQEQNSGVKATATKEESSSPKPIAVEPSKDDRITNTGGPTEQPAATPLNNLSPAAAAKKKEKDGNNNKVPTLELPFGYLPPVFKDCLLSNCLRSGRRAMEHLKDVRETLSNLVAVDEHLSKGLKKESPSHEMLQLSLVAEALTLLTREGFVPAHRLNQTALSLYNTEDLLRFPKTLPPPDPSSMQIKVPDATFNYETLDKARLIVDKAAEFYNKFSLKGSNGADLENIMFKIMRAFQDMYTLVLGADDIFKVLLYPSIKEKKYFLDFLLTLSSRERSDMLAEVQDLRRLIDELVIFIEKLSWGAFVVYRLASGNGEMQQPQNDDKPTTSTAAKGRGSNENVGRGGGGGTSSKKAAARGPPAEVPQAISEASLMKQLQALNGKVGKKGKRAKGTKKQGTTAVQTDEIKPKIKKVKTKKVANKTTSVTK